MTGSGITVPEHATRTVRRVPNGVAAMGVLSRLRSWFAGGTTEKGDAEDDAAETDATESGLDPDNVTEVRTGSSDDAADKLREVSDRRAEESEQSVDG